MCSLFPQTLTKGGVTYRDEPWHKECFVCTGCMTPLAGQQFTSQDDNPYCIKCFGNLYAKKCSACTKPITGELDGPRDDALPPGRRWLGDEPRPLAVQTACPNCSPRVLMLCSVPPTGFGGGKYISFEDRHWHHNCFNCARCDTSLVGKGFIPDNDEILCRDCSNDL